MCVYSLLIRLLALNLASLIQPGTKGAIVTNSIFLSGQLLSELVIGQLRLGTWMNQHNPFFLLTVSAAVSMPPRHSQRGFVRLQVWEVTPFFFFFLTGVGLWSLFSGSMSQWNRLEACALQARAENWNWRFSLGFGTWLTKCVAGTSLHSSMEHSGFLIHSLGWPSRSRGGSN